MVKFICIIFKLRTVISLFLIRIDLLMAGVIQGLDLSFSSRLEICFTGAWVSIISDSLVYRESNK